MDREGTTASLNQRLMVALARGARAQEDSRALVAATHVLQARLHATRTTVRARRARRPPPRRRG